MTDIQLKTADGQRAQTQVEILDETRDNAFVRYPDGTVDNISMSNRNRLLFKHGMWDVFFGDQILQVTQDDGSSVTLTPLEDGGFDLAFPNETFRVTPSDVPDLVDALIKLYEWEEETQPLWNFYDEVLSGRVRIEIVNEIGNMYPFSELIGNTIEITSDGWLLHDKLLLSWDCEFRMPDRQMVTRTGRVIDPEANQSSLEFIDDIDPDPITVELNGINTRLSDKEMLFFTNAVYAIEQL